MPVKKPKLGWPKAWQRLREKRYCSSTNSAYIKQQKVLNRVKYNSRRNRRRNKVP